MRHRTRASPRQNPIPALLFNLIAFRGLLDHIDDQRNSSQRHNPLHERLPTKLSTPNSLNSHIRLL
ncbi:MAG: hypothetical protein ACHQT8_00445 [Chlamydiales bacterium]